MLTKKQIKDLLLLAEEAGNLVMYYFDRDYQINTKTDHSPVTEADLAVSQMLEKELQKIYAIPVLSEENIPKDIAYQNWQAYWLIDPIDGTRSFIKKDNQFCICIALIQNYQPILGMIYSPTEKTNYFAIKGSGVFEKKRGGSVISLKTPKVVKNDSLILVLGHSNLSKKQQFLLKDFDYQVIRTPSALKYIDLIKQKANLNFRLGITYEWDTAAGQIILEEAGGRVIDCFGNVVRYGDKQVLFNQAMISFMPSAASYIQQIRVNYCQFDK